MLLVVPWQVLWSVLLLIAITSVVIWMVKRSPYLATGWLWYAGTLVPVSGIVQVGSFAMADRYTYIPLIGLFIMVAWGFPDLLKKWNYQKEMLLILSALSILCLCIITWTQVGYWQNSITLFDHTLKVTDNNWLAYNIRGAAYNGLGNYKQAIEDLNKAIEIEPGYADAYYNRGIAYKGLGNYKEAIEDFDRAIEIRPGFAEAYIKRGLAYTMLGNSKQAIEDFTRASKRSEAALDWFNKARELINTDPKKTIEYLNNAIKLQPNFVEAYDVQGVTYEGLGQYQRAIEDFNQAIRLRPDFARNYYRRGIAYTRLDQHQRAIEDFNQAIRLKPDFADAYQSRGVTYTVLLQYQRAIEDYNKAISLKPDDVESYNCRGYAYFKQGNNKLGCPDAKKACDLGNCKLLEVANTRGLCR
jgi:tetratricopeptide (TPR) repeat protein